VGNVAEATNFTTSPAVTVEDASGNVVTTDTGNVTLAKNAGPAAGVLSCSNGTFSTIAAVAGVATFTNCQISGTAAAGTYTLQATRAGLTSTGASANVVINVGAANQLAFTTQPGGGVTALVWKTQPVVTVEDANGNTVTSSSASVQLSINTQPGGGATIACTSNPLSVTSGVASFAGCSITGSAGTTYTLKAVAGSLSTISTQFAITAGIHLYQQAPVMGSSNATSETTTFASPPVSGDTIIVLVGDDGNHGDTVSGLSGGGVTAWAKAASVLASPTNNGEDEIWYGTVACGGTCPSADEAVKATMNSGGGSTNIEMVDTTEWSGISTTNPLDTVASSAAGSASGSGFSVTTTGSLAEQGELVITNAWIANTNFSSPQNATTGYTRLNETTAGGSWYRAFGAYQIDTGTAAISATWPIPSSPCHYATAIAAFQPY
jgi:hypothetical protein